MLHVSLQWEGVNVFFKTDVLPKLRLIPVFLGSLTLHFSLKYSTFFSSNAISFIVCSRCQTQLIHCSVAWSHMHMNKSVTHDKNEKAQSQWPGDCNTSFTREHQRSFTTHSKVLLRPNTCIIGRINAGTHLYLHFHEWKTYSLLKEIDRKSNR